MYYTHDLIGAFDVINTYKRVSRMTIATVVTDSTCAKNIRRCHRALRPVTIGMGFSLYDETPSIGMAANSVRHATSSSKPPRVPHGFSVKEKIECWHLTGSGPPYDPVIVSLSAFETQLYACFQSARATVHSEMSGSVKKNLAGLRIRLLRDNFGLKFR